MDEGGIRCWGNNAYDFSPIKSRRHVSLGYSDICVVDKESLRCWYRLLTKERELGLPPLKRFWSSYSFDFSPGTVDRELVKLERYAYAYRGAFYAKIARRLRDLPKGSIARLYVMNAIVPVLTDEETDFFKTVVLRDYNEALAAGNKSATIGALADIPLDRAVLEISLELARCALEACRSFVGGDKPNAELEALVVFTGRTLASLGQGDLAASAKQVSRGLEAHAALITALTAERRTHGFGVLIPTVGEYLRGRE